MNKYSVSSLLLGLLLILGSAGDAFAQHKGISFQAVMKKSDGSYPSVTGISVTAQILDPVNNCILREEEHTGKNITKGYLNLVLGDSGVATPAIRNPSPVLTISQVLDNQTTRTGLKCVDQNNNILATGQSYIPSNIDRRILRVRLNILGEDIVADFNMRAVAYAVNAEMLNSKSDTDFINVNGAKGVEQNKLESIFERFTKLDAILNNSNGSGTSLGVNISGNAATATSVTGTVGIANGGTGATTAADARTNLDLGPLAAMKPTGTADATTYLRGDGTWQAIGGGGAVSSVAGRTGAVTLTTADVSGLGALATKTTSGTADNTTYLRGDGAWTALGGAALLNVGTGAGTVAAGDDSRISKAIQNGGSGASSDIVAISAGADSSKPGAPVAGQMYVATDAQKIYRFDGGSWITVAQVGASGFTGSLSGDVSGTQSSTSVDKIKGQAVTATASTAGQVLRYAGSNNWTPSFVAMTDLRSTVTGGSQLGSSCLAHQTLTYNSVGDVMQCASIAGLDAAVLTTGTIADSLLPASVKYWTAVTDGINYATGRVGVNVSSPSAQLDVRSPASYAVPATLSGNITAGVTSISVSSTAGYPTSGVLLIDDELIAYTGITGTSFTGLTRGFSGTTAAAHLAGAYTEVLAMYAGGNVKTGILTSDEIRVGATTSATVIDSGGTILPGVTTSNEGDVCNDGGAIVRDAAGDVMICSD
ncbi:MAG: hypothetical protein HUU57_03025 [Bdellovibrio sp.]|nr:hypothetical protein [Bdellovibrio sp.]